MDPVMNQMARELADVISAVVAGDTRVDACREKARAAGYDMRVALDAAVTFVPCGGHGTCAGVRHQGVAGTKGVAGHDRQRSTLPEVAQDLRRRNH